MPDFVDALSSYGRRVSDYVKERYRRFSNWAGVKKYRLGRSYRGKASYVKDNLTGYGKAYGKYFLYEFAPYVAAYGLMINFPLGVLLGWELSAATVVSWGLVFYFVSEELTDIANELKPYIRVNAKVDN